jgi:hypothetical protein
MNRYYVNVLKWHNKNRLIKIININLLIHNTDVLYITIVVNFISLIFVSFITIVVYIINYS